MTNNGLVKKARENDKCLRDLLEFYSSDRFGYHIYGHN